MKQIYDMWVEREIAKCKDILKIWDLRDIEREYIEKYLKSLEELIVKNGNN